MRNSLWFLLLMTLIPGGCQREATTTGANPAGNGANNESGEPEIKGTIGYSAQTLTNPFFLIIGDTMNEEAKPHGYEVVTVSADQDSKKQSDQIDDFIVKGVSAIVLTPVDAQALGPAIKRANDAGIPVFTNDTAHTGEEGEVVCHIATDNFQGGKLAGEAMVKALGESGGEVAILELPQVTSCIRRVEGFKEVIAAHNAQADTAKIEIVATLDGKASRDGSLIAAKDALEANPNLSAIFAINDPSALGAYAALESVGKQDQVILIGFDGQKSGKQAILEGKILCDPIQFPDRMGKTTIEQIVKYFDGDEVPETILIPSELYYKADAEQDPELKDE